MFHFFIFPFYVVFCRCSIFVPPDSRTQTALSNSLHSPLSSLFLFVLSGFRPRAAFLFLPSVFTFHYRSVTHKDHLVSRVVRTPSPDWRGQGHWVRGVTLNAQTRVLGLAPSAKLSLPLFFVLPHVAELLF